MTPTIQPREYQLEALEAILSRQNSGITSQLVCLPTGTGKTILFGLLAKEMNTRTLIIAHREQLIKQAVDKASLVWPDVSIGICMADRDDLNAQVVVASIQSASRPNRLERLKKCGFSLCVVDEAHHAASNSYKNLLQELGFLGGDSGKLLVGVTATPLRKDGGLGNIFQEVVFDRSISTMIRAGYLSNLRGHRVLTSTSLDGVSLSNGDFTEYQLSDVCNSPERNSLIANSFLENCPERKGIAFTCDVKHAVDLAKAFQAKGVNASAIYGAVPDEEKRSIMDRFACGKIQVLINCALLTEGYDQTDISTVLMCRPTRSQALYIQCIGRGTRLHPGKADCLVLDFCDKFHDIQSIATLDRAVSLSAGEPEEGRNDTSSKKRAPSKVFVGEQILGDFDLLDRSQFAWVPVKEHWHLQLSPNCSLWLMKEETGYMPTFHHDGRVESLVTRAVPLDYAMGLSEDYARRNKDFNSWSSKNAKWRSEEPTDKQIDVLQKMGYSPEGLTRGESNQKISQKINERKSWRYAPATSRQRFVLRKNRIKVRGGMKKGEAYDIIKDIKRKEALECLQNVVAEIGHE